MSLRYHGEKSRLERKEQAPKCRLTIEVSSEQECAAADQSKHAKEADSLQRRHPTSQHISLMTKHDRQLTAFKTLRFLSRVCSGTSQYIQCRIAENSTSKRLKEFSA